MYPHTITYPHTYPTVPKLYIYRRLLRRAPIIILHWASLATMA